MLKLDNFSKQNWYRRKFYLPSSGPRSKTYLIFMKLGRSFRRTCWTQQQRWTLNVTSLGWLVELDEPVIRRIMVLTRKFIRNSVAVAKRKVSLSGVCERFRQIKVYENVLPDFVSFYAWLLIYFVCFLL